MGRASNLLRFPLWKEIDVLTSDSLTLSNLAWLHVVTRSLTVAGVESRRWPPRLTLAFARMHTSRVEDVNPQPLSHVPNHLHRTDAVSRLGSDVGKTPLWPRYLARWPPFHRRPRSLPVIRLCKPIDRTPHRGRLASSLRECMVHTGWCHQPQTLARRSGWPPECTGLIAGEYSIATTEGR